VVTITCGTYAKRAANRGTARVVTIPLDRVPVLTTGWQQIGQAALLP